MRELHLTRPATLRLRMINHVVVTFNKLSQLLQRGGGSDARRGNKNQPAPVPRRVIALSTAGKLAASTFGRPTRQITGQFSALHTSPANANTAHTTLSNNPIAGRVVALR